MGTPKQNEDGSAGNFSEVEDRSQLLSRARSFLQSPQISMQDAVAKRKFLQEKGLNDVEIEVLLRDMPPSTPLVPPRTYPQPPPSNLPNLLLGLSRIFSWLAGGSALLVFIYYRFLLPRIIQTSTARRSLKNHHLTLMKCLTDSLTALKKEQKEAWSVLPKSDPWKEPIPCINYLSVDDVRTSFKNQSADYTKVPAVTLLRCALEDVSKGQETEVSPTTEELFRHLEEQIPWLLTPDGLKYEQILWETLSTCPRFVANPPLSSTEQDSQSHSRWSYSPLSQDPSPIYKSLSTLRLSLPKDNHGKPNVFQGTLQTLSEFTGYISTQVYAPYRPLNNVVNSGNNSNPIEDQLRREIRALKGLVLNRRSFIPKVTTGSISVTTS